MMNDNGCNRLFNIYGATGGSFAGNVYGTDGVAPCLGTMDGGNRMPLIVEMSYNRPVLDACCGGRMFYFDKHDERVLFQDIREVETVLCDGRPFCIKPDVIGDFTDMPYPDETFRLVVFDPPHLKYDDSGKQPSGWQFKKYGYLPRHGWQDCLRRGFSECFRVLQSGGFLVFKWNETDIMVSEVLRLTPYKPILGHISGKRANTHWILFMK